MEYFVDCQTKPAVVVLLWVNFYVMYVFDQISHYEIMQQIFQINYVKRNATNNFLRQFNWWERSVIIDLGNLSIGMYVTMYVSIVIVDH